MRSLDAHGIVWWVVGVRAYMSPNHRQSILMHMKEAFVRWITSEKRYAEKRDSEGGGQTCILRECSRQARQSF